MKKQTIITILLAFVVSLTAKAQVDLIGSWSGKMELGTAKLTIVLHLKQEDGHINVTMDSPDQSVYGMPCMKMFLSYDSLMVSVRSIGAAYGGRLKDGR